MIRQLYANPTSDYWSDLCAYCTSEENTDFIEATEKEFITACPSHTLWAKRDCDAWLHKHKQARLLDLYRVNPTVRLLEAAQISVGSTNLSVQLFINEPVYQSANNIIFDEKNNMWLIPVWSNKSDDDTLQNVPKNFVPLDKFAEYGIEKTKLDALKQQLEDGIYKS